MQRIAILYTPAGGGHRAAAHAIAAELGRLPATHIDVRNVLDFAPRWFAYDRAWRFVQRHGDFVALPIALGLGIDYAINVAHRAERDDPGIALRSTGGTVLVCSLTTMIGYASLLVSNNLAIRGFGLASLIGEITCVVTALALVPAMISIRWRRGVSSRQWQDGSRSAA